jgi:RNase P protein component
MNAEIRMLAIGLRNKDFRPGVERDNAQRRLRHLLMLAQNNNDRPRGTIVLRPNV